MVVCFPLAHSAWPVIFKVCTICVVNVHCVPSTLGHHSHRSCLEVESTTYKIKVCYYYTFNVCVEPYRELSSMISMIPSLEHSLLTTCNYYGILYSHA